MGFQLRRGHAGPCPLVTRGDSYGATAMGTVNDEFPCTCGRVWQIQEFCLYCEKIKIAHARHSVRQYWVMVEDRVWTSRLVTGYFVFAVLTSVVLVLHWPL